MTAHTMRANAVYVLLYASGIYGLVLWPPVQRVVTAVAEPLRRALALEVEHLPLLVRVILALAAFDALAYWVHRAAHASPLLWRIHRVHHSDPCLILHAAEWSAPVRVSGAARVA